MLPPNTIASIDGKGGTSREERLVPIKSPLASAMSEASGKTVLVMPGPGDTVPRAITT